MKQQVELNPTAAACSQEIDTGPENETITTHCELGTTSRPAERISNISQDPSRHTIDPASLVSQLASRAELASTLPPYEAVVGLAHAQEILASALMSRLESSAPASERERLIRDLVSAVTHQRALVHSTTTVFGCDLREAGHRVDAALTALVACP